MGNEKFILDACCGGRMFWFNKHHPNTLYIDNRKAGKGHVKERGNHTVDPDIIMDFRDLKFPDKSFKIVVWDPPHLINLSDNSWIKKKYGSLNAETWQSDLKKGFDECWRVLEDYGVLIFKWSVEISGKTRSTSLKNILKIIDREPLFGHTPYSKVNTVWLCFMKIPEVVTE